MPSIPLDTGPDARGPPLTSSTPHPADRMRLRCGYAYVPFISAIGAVFGSLFSACSARCTSRRTLGRGTLRRTRLGCAAADGRRPQPRPGAQLLGVLLRDPQRARPPTLGRARQVPDPTLIMQLRETAEEPEQSPTRRLVIALNLSVFYYETRNLRDRRARTRRLSCSRPRRTSSEAQRLVIGTQGSRSAAHAPGQPLHARAGAVYVPLMTRNIICLAIARTICGAAHGHNLRSRKMSKRPIEGVWL